MALNLTVKVHPVVLFQIVDAYERRSAESHRVIGTLLGMYDVHFIRKVLKKSINDSKLGPHGILLFPIKLFY